MSLQFLAWQLFYRPNLGTEMMAKIVSWILKSNVQLPLVEVAEVEVLPGVAV